MKRLEMEHCGWKQLWCDRLEDVAVGEEDGAVYGSLLNYMEQNILAMEESLTDHLREQCWLSWHPSLPGMKGAAPMSYPGGRLLFTQCFMTYTVPLAQVRQDLRNWTPSLAYEVNSLAQVVGHQGRSSRAMPRCWWSPPSLFLL